MKLDPATGEIVSESDDFGLSQEALDKISKSMEEKILQTFRAQGDLAPDQQKVWVAMDLAQAHMPLAFVIKPKFTPKPAPGDEIQQLKLLVFNEIASIVDIQDALATNVTTTNMVMAGQLIEQRFAFVNHVMELIERLIALEIALLGPAVETAVASLQATYQAMSAKDAGS